MYYSNVKLLWPLKYIDSEFKIPETADLRGLTYDYMRHQIITFDQTERKLMWISRDDSLVQASCAIGSPVDDVIGISSFNDLLYILNYRGDGRLSVCTGSLAQGREDGSMNITEYEVPYSDLNLSGTPVWSLTHAALPKYLRYHPNFCNIFTRGPTVYLLLGLCDNIVRNPATPPANLGQYIVEFDLNGLFHYQTKIDNSPSLGNRPATIDTINGTAVAACPHDGIVDILCRELNPDQPSVIHTLKYNKGATVLDTFWYMTGTLPIGSALMTAGRYVYTLINNRIYKAEIIMLSLSMEAGWPSTSTLDLGTMSAGETVFRRVTCKNVSPVSTYHDITINSKDPMLLLSKTNSIVVPDYNSTITIEGAFAPGDEFTFYVCLTAPQITDDNYDPYQYYDYITFHPRAKVDSE